MSDLTDTINVLDIIGGTTVDGIGLRTSIYLSGCSHRCKSCHNPQSWNPNAGTPMTISEILEAVKEEDFNVTLTGGDPLFNPLSTAKLANVIRSEGYSIWLYTGFTWEQILINPQLRKVLKFVDVLVDGPFIESLKDNSLRFRGSSNQRLIDVQESIIKCDYKIVEWCDK